VAVSCVDAHGTALMPCGRCRQLLWENGGSECLVMSPDGVMTMAEVLPLAFGAEDIDKVTGASHD
jgi:cytidine deaminase